MPSLSLASTKHPNLRLHRPIANLKGSKHLNERNAHINEGDAQHRDNVSPGLQEPNSDIGGSPGTLVPEASNMPIGSQAPSIVPTVAETGSAPQPTFAPIASESGPTRGPSIVPITSDPGLTPEPTIAPVGPQSAFTPVAGPASGPAPTVEPVGTAEPAPTAEPIATAEPSLAGGSKK